MGSEKQSTAAETARYQRITRKDVAREAGVTETIVSYVLNNNRYVSSDKRQRVLAAVKKLGYRPNTAARALKGKRLNHIVFIADQIVTEHFSLLLNKYYSKHFTNTNSFNLYDCPIRFVLFLTPTPKMDMYVYAHSVTKSCLTL